MNGVKDLEAGSTLRRGEDVVAQEAADELLLLHMARERYFGLNHVGRRVWELIGDHGATLGSVVDAIADEFSADRSTVAADLQELVGDMVDQGVLTVH